MDERISTTAVGMNEGFPTGAAVPSICAVGTEPGGKMEKMYGLTSAVEVS